MEESFPLISEQNPSGHGEITAMNNDGSIYAGQNSVLGAFVKRGEVFTPIAVPNNNSLPTGVSDDGMVVVGSWGSPFTGKTPWVWTESGGAQEANEFFFGQGVSIPEYVTLTEMFGVSRDGLTFLAKYDGSGPKPGGAIVITLPGEQDAWTDQGNALAGVTGDPLLVGTGTLVHGDVEQVAAVLRNQ